MTKNYIYWSADNKLVFHDYIVEFYYSFKRSGNNSPADFSEQLLRNIADRFYITQLYCNEINSKTFEFFIGLYKYMEKEGGISACEKLSNYTYNINNPNTVKELVNSGVLRKEEAKLNNDELVIKLKNNNSKKLNILNYIFRDRNGYLILPYEIYNAYNCFDGENAKQFAQYAINKISENIEYATEDLFKFFVMIFELIEKEKYCTTISYYNNNKPVANEKEFIESMLKANKATMYQINLNKDGTISETLVKDSSITENSMYNFDNTKLVNNVYITELIFKIKNIEQKLHDIKNNINISNENEYLQHKNQLNTLATEIKELYKEAKNKLKTDDIQNKDFLAHLEIKYNEINEKINILLSKSKKIYDIVNKYQTEEKENKTEEKNLEKVDYYKQIQTELETFETELNNISQNVVIKSEKDYMAYHSKLSHIRNKLHDFYNSSIKEAHRNGRLTGPLLKESTTKHNQLMKQIDETSNMLDTLKKQLLFKNIFNG